MKKVTVITLLLTIVACNMYSSYKEEYHPFETSPLSFRRKKGSQIKPTPSLIADATKALTRKKPKISVKKFYGKTIMIESDHIGKKINKIKILANNIILEKRSKIPLEAIYYIEIYTKDGSSKISLLEISDNAFSSYVKKLIEKIKKLIKANKK